MVQQEKQVDFKPGHSLKIIFAVILISLFSALPLQAQFSENVDLTFTAEKEDLTVGDPVKLTLRVNYPATYEITIPTLPERWGDFEVCSQSEPETTLNDNGTKTTTQIVEVTLFEVGTFQTPAWSVILQDQSGKTTERAVPQVSLTVISVLKEGDAELRDIKPQAELPVPPTWPWIVGGLIVAALLVWGGWQLYRRLRERLKRRPQAAAPETVIDPRPPHIIAYEELTRIERLDLPGQGRFKEYYSLVADCLRRYLEGMYQLPAMDLTTTEIRWGLRHAPILPAHARQFVTLFNVSDLVKFARLIPKMEEVEQLIPQARALIDLTKPEAPAPEGEPKAVPEVAA